MAVCNVKVVSIIGTNPSLDGVSKICGNCGFFVPGNIQDFNLNSEGLTPYNESNPYSELIKRLEEIAVLLGKRLSFVNIDRFNAGIKEVADFVEKLDAKVKDLESKKKETIKNIENLEKSLSLINKFCGKNLNLEEIFKCEYVTVRFGRLSKEAYKKLETLKNDSYIMFFPCKEEGNYYWGVYFAPTENLKEVDSFFSGLYFEHVKISKEDYKETPEQSEKYIKDKIEKEKVNLKNTEEQMGKIWETSKEQILRFYTKLKELETYFSVKKYSYAHKDSFLLMGWIPEEKEVEFSNLLDSVDGIEYKYTEADTSKGEEYLPPVKLKNNWFSRPFENFVKMYGLPKYNEFDPTLFVAITYTILYGIMFGDLGHGIVLFIAGLLLKKFKNFSLAPIMTRCGISASIFGTIYGSLFGFEKALNPFFKAVFGLKEKPIEVMSSSAIPKVLACAIFLGVTLLVVAMIINAVTSILSGDIENGIFGPNGLCGLLFYTSVVSGAVFQLVLNIKVFNVFYVSFLIVLPLILIFLKTPIANLVSGKKLFEGQSAGDYILQNVFEMFTIILEYISNTVSFLRVGAYVLVHSGLMMAVFIIANMFPAASFIVLILGNVFVVGFEGLLVGIQVLRLEFYELFSRCFSGGGKEFLPVRALKVNS